MLDSFRQTVAESSDAGPNLLPIELVHRPASGLARGVWEARPWQLYLALVAAALFAGIYGAARLGLIWRKQAPKISADAVDKRR